MRGCARCSVVVWGTGRQCPPHAHAILILVGPYQIDLRAQAYRICLEHTFNANMNMDRVSNMANLCVNGTISESCFNPL